MISPYPPGFFPAKKSLQLVAVVSGFGDDKEAESSVCAKGTKSKDCKEEADGDGMVTDEQRPVDPVYVVKIYKGLY